MLTYIGAGAALFDIPARDISEDELIELAERLGLSAAALQENLLTSGLYEHSQAGE